jgi:hypothetical protein
LSAQVLLALLLSAQFLPPLPEFVEPTISMMAGTVAATSVILFVGLLNYLLPTPRLAGGLLDLNGRLPTTTLLIVALVFLHAIIADYYLALGDLMRCVSSFFPLMFVLAGGAVLGRALRRCAGHTVEWALSVSFGILCLVGALRVLGLEPPSSVLVKATFPFTEVSHFALAFLPVLIYRAVQAPPRHKSWWVLASLLIGLALQSLSLLAGSLLVAAACRRWLLLVLAVPAAVAVLFSLPAGLGLDYYLNRLDFSGDVANLSNLVYVQGWQLMLESWTLSSGWGLGFQQLGTHQTQVSSAQLIRTITGGVDTNVMDGGFVLSKLVSEFGFLGIALALVFVVAAARCLKALRAGRGDPATTFARCVVLSYSVDMFIRGTGYFTQSTLLFVAAIVVLNTNRQSVVSQLGSAPQHAQLS